MKSAPTSSVEEEKQRDNVQKKMKTNVNKNVVVRERDFKSETTHSDLVTGIVTVDDSEFITSSMDHTLKLWDKFT